MIGYNPSFASWARLLCNIRREILCWASRLTMFGIKRSAHFGSKNINTAACCGWERGRIVFWAKLTKVQKSYEKRIFSLPQIVVARLQSAQLTPCADYCEYGTCSCRQLGQMSNGFNVLFTSIPYNNHKMFCLGYLWFLGVIKSLEVTTKTTTNSWLSEKNCCYFF